MIKADVQIREEGRGCGAGLGAPGPQQLRVCAVEGPQRPSPGPSISDGEAGFKGGGDGMRTGPVSLLQVHCGLRPAAALLYQRVGAQPTPAAVRQAWDLHSGR